MCLILQQKQLEKLYQAWFLVKQIIENALQNDEISNQDLTQRNLLQ